MKNYLPVRHPRLRPGQLVATDLQSELVGPERFLEESSQRKTSRALSRHPGHPLLFGDAWAWCHCLEATNGHASEE